MRDSGLLTVLAISMVIFGGIAYLIWKQPAGLSHVLGVSVRVKESQASQTPAADSSKKKEPKTAKTKNKGPVSADGKASGDAARLSLKDLVFPLSMPKPQAPFPDPGDIEAGATRSRLWAAYGEPNMRTYAVERGRVLETYVYLKSDGKVATFARLLDGRVVSAYSASQ